MIDSILVVKPSHAVFFFGSILSESFILSLFYNLQLDLTLFLNSTSDII